MGFSDQKYYDRPQVMVADSNVATGTFTASVAAATGTAALTPFTVPTFKRTSKLIAASLLVKTANKIGTMVVSILNGTTTIGTLTASSTAASGSELTFTLLNTASLSTATQTITAANGSTSTNTVTSTTDWTVIASNTAPTFVVVGSATASGDTLGAFEVFFTVQEQPRP
jgi:hypothetical protein